MRLTRVSRSTVTVASRPRASRSERVLTPDEAVERATLLLPGTPRGRSKLGPDQMSEIEDRLRADTDETMTEIARSFGVSVGRVSQINDTILLRMERELALINLHEELTEAVASGEIDVDYACELMLLVAWKPRGFLRLRDGE